MDVKYAKPVSRARPLGLSPRDLSGQRFVYNWSLLNDLGIPMEEWHDLFQTGLELLKVFVSNPQIEDMAGIPGYQEFLRQYRERTQLLMTDPRYAELFTQLEGH